MENDKLDKHYYYGNQRNEILEYIPKDIGTILDVGCGYGGFLDLVKNNRNVETWGIELVNSVAETLNGHVDFILNGSIEANCVSLPNNYFDCITFNDVLEHLMYPDEVLNSIHDKFSDKGILVASIPNVRFLRNLYNLLIHKDWKYEDSGILDRTHFRFFTKKSMVRLFEDSGYEVISINGIFKLNAFKFKIFNFITFGFFEDCLFERFVCVLRSVR
jgi:2-polyprenyl-3-methyl-5-hydroxy-6-metoxy-1,4-benzoquinol methylase